MCGVIVVDAGRSRSTNLGRDAYIMIIAWISSWLFEVLSIANSNCFLAICYFSREKPLVIPTAPGSLFIMFAFAIYFPLLLFSDPLNQKYLAALYFICAPFILSITTLSCLLANFWRRYPKGIDNPFNTSGCEHLLFVCRGCLRCVAWFSYWFDNLGLITKGDTYRRCAASSLPLWGNTDVVLAGIKRNFWRCCRGDIININQVPNNKSHFHAI